MKITVNSQRLAQELRLLNKVVASKPVLPILGHLLVTASNTLSLMATDLEAILVASCPATIAEPGRVALPAAKTLALCEQFTDGEVTITSTEKQAQITCGRFSTTVQVQPSGDFPVLPEEAGTSATLDAGRLRQLIERTDYAASNAETQPVLRGALLTLTATGSAMVTTDGKRLALATTLPSSTPLAAPIQAILPSKALSVLKAYDEVSDLIFTVGERHLFFRMAGSGRLLVSRTLEGQFPKFERIIPRENEHKLVIPRFDLLASLRRVLLIADDTKTVVLKISTDALDLSSASAEIGSAEERVPVTYAGPELTLKVNGAHLSDFLLATVHPSVTMAIKDARMPVLLTEGDSHLGVIIPVQ